jgi:putative restriction endonuclease
MEVKDETEALRFSPDDTDQKIRLAAFDWLSKQSNIHGDILKRELLARGFPFEGRRIPLVSPQGIFKPEILPEIPLSITTTARSPYDDSFDADDLLRYRYRGTDPHHRDNEGLRKAMIRGVPLIYFHGVVPGKYVAIWPVYIVGDSPEELAFKVAPADPSHPILARSTDFAGRVMHDQGDEIRRAYRIVAVKQRIHQAGFREKVLLAYQEQCACCKLKHVELLDAAHIIADSKPEGIPTVSNGISLCKLHHAAFDSNLMGIRPDYLIEVRKDVLEEEDGPVLLHGLVFTPLLRQFPV